MCVGTDLTNNRFLGSPAYGMVHHKDRITPEALVETGPETCIPNLYLTGQVLT